MNSVNSFELSRFEEKSLHWSEHQEQASCYWHVRLLLLLFRYLPMLIVRILTVPVAISYFIVSRNARVISQDFLQRIAGVLAVERGNKKVKLHPFKHFHAFALTVVEKVEAWGGKVAFKRIHFQDDDISDLITGLEQGKGAFLICSHLGNAELLRGLANFNRTGVSRNIRVTSIVDFSIGPYFSRMLQELNPESMLHIISANEVSPETVIQLQDRIAAGELVVIAGDRTSANTRNKYFQFPFLGANAPFPMGPFFLAAMLNAPTYFVFALRQKDVGLSSQYNMYVHKSPLSFDCSRKERNQRMEELAHLFVCQLEYYCKQHPYQWYNFFDFWAKPEA